MRTFPVTEISGRLVEFGIDSTYISIGQIIRLLSTISGVEHIQRRRPFSANSDMHVRFDFGGVPFIVLEPFGDNNQYWIGPENPDTAEVDAGPLRKVFDDCTPSALRNFFGDLLTLRFIKREPD